MDKAQLKAKKVVQTILSKYTPAQLHNGFWIGPLFLQIRARKGQIEVIGCHIEDPKYLGRGYAAKGFRRLMRHLDEHKMRSKLIVMPYGDKTSKQIRDWYSQFGYKLVPGWQNVMRRPAASK